jgi:Bacterial Ig domain
VRHFCWTFLVLASAALCSPLFAQLPVNLKPVTTVNQETVNNTSASGTYSDPSVGTVIGNVSKLPMSQLLPGFQGKIYASVVLFWGSGSGKHINVGYSAADPAQVDRQIKDIISRGMKGAILDWYGPNSWQEKATQVWFQEAAKFPGFEIAIQEDHNSLTLNSCKTSACAQKALINDFNYVATHYFGSGHYIHINGRPLLTTFDVNWNYADPSAILFPDDVIYVDWKTVRASIKGNPLIIQRGPLAQTEFGVMADGAFAWVGRNKLDPTDEFLQYLTDFDTTALKNPNQVTLGAFYKGFNDAAASWGTGRRMDAHCGKLWVDTFAANVQALGNQINQIPAFQAVTWNDYEEGTNIETGVDNCISVSAGLSGTKLKWSINPDNADTNATISMFVVYISSDGKNLAQVQVRPTSARTLDLTQYAIPAGNYKLFVKARGQPSVQNHLSSGVAFTVYSTLKVASPKSNQTVTNPVTFSATASSKLGVASIVLSIDGTNRFTSNSNTLNTSLSLPFGPHQYLYTVWDKANHKTQQGGTITVN